MSQAGPARRGCACSSAEHAAVLPAHAATATEAPVAGTSGAPQQCCALGLCSCTRAGAHLRPSKGPAVALLTPQRPCGLPAPPHGSKMVALQASRTLRCTVAVRSQLQRVGPRQLGELCEIPPQTRRLPFGARRYKTGGPQHSLRACSRLAQQMSCTQKLTGLLCLLASSPRSAACRAGHEPVPRVTLMEALSGLQGAHTWPIPCWAGARPPRAGRQPAGCPASCRACRWCPVSAWRCTPTAQLVRACSQAAALLAERIWSGLQSIGDFFQSFSQPRPQRTEEAGPGAGRHPCCCSCWLCRLTYASPSCTALAALTPARAQAFS